MSRGKKDNQIIFSRRQVCNGYRLEEQFSSSDGLDSAVGRVIDTSVGSVARNLTNETDKTECLCFKPVTMETILLLWTSLTALMRFYGNQWKSEPRMSPDSRVSRRAREEWEVSTKTDRELKSSVVIPFNTLFSGPSLFWESVVSY